MDWEEVYVIGGLIAGALTFLIVWIGCSLSYGFLGFALGWMPAAILAYIVRVFWPFILGIGIVAAIVFIHVLR